MQKLDSRKSIYNKIYAEFIGSGCRFWTDSRKVNTRQMLSEQDDKGEMVGSTELELKNGGVFFALSGERFDANDFALDALNQGASMAVVDRKEMQQMGDSRIVVVDNVLEAMTHVAMLHRERMDFEVIALTGSNGKTTTKELMVKALSCRYRVAATQGNLNNHIGVPITLLSVDIDATDVLVVEMGANHPGEIEYLCKIARPTIGLVTNVGVAHLEGFGSKEGVRKTKGELYDYLINNGGTIIYNSEDDILNKMILERENNVQTRHRIMGYTCVDLGITDQTINSEGNLEFKYNGRIVDTNIVGLYNIKNIAASLAVSKYLGLDMDSVVKCVASYSSNNNRSQRLIRPSGNTVILDAYNANPSSMEVALDNFARLLDSQHYRNAILVLGDMKELGEDSVHIHSQVLEYAMAALNRCENMSQIRIWLVGECMAKAMGDVEIESSICQWMNFGNVEVLKKYLMTQPQEKQNDQIILVKGSRSMKLEEVVEFL